MPEILLGIAANTAFDPNILSTHSDALLPEGFLRKDVSVNGPCSVKTLLRV